MSNPFEPAVPRGLPLRTFRDFYADPRGVAWGRPVESDRATSGRGTGSPDATHSQRAAPRAPGSRSAAPAWRDSNIFLTAAHLEGLERALKGSKGHLRAVPARPEQVAKLRQSFRGGPVPPMEGLRNLQVDSGFVPAQNAFRWGLLTDVVDSRETVLLRSVSPLGLQKELHFLGPDRKIHSGLIAETVAPVRGETLVSRALQRKIFGSLVAPAEHGRRRSTGSTSWSDDVSQVYLINTGAMKATQTTVAHELLGHMWFAVNGMPLDHDSAVSPAVKTPDGSPFKGRVIDYINRFVAP